MIDAIYRRFPTLERFLAPTDFRKRRLKVLYQQYVARHADGAEPHLGEGAGASGPGRARRRSSDYRFYLLHIPKCAGTTFTALARANCRPFEPNGNGAPLYADERVIPFWTWPVEEQLRFLSDDGHDFVANETCIGADMPLADGLFYLTVLREPLDRVFSHFRYIMENRSSDPGAQSFEEFVHHGLDESANRWACNRMVRQFARDERRGLTKADLQLAKDRIEQVAEVFLLESLDRDIGRMERYGWRELNLGRYSARVHGALRMREHVRDGGTLRALEAANELDMDLVDHVSTHLPKWRAKRDAVLVPVLRPCPLAPTKSSSLLLVEAHAALRAGDLGVAMAKLEALDQGGLPPAERSCYHTLLADAFFALGDYRSALDEVKAACGGVLAGKHLLKYVRILIALADHEGVASILEALPDSALLTKHILPTTRHLASTDGEPLREAAMHLLARGCAAQPNNPRFHTALARLQAREGLMGEALATFSKAVSLAPGNPELRGDYAEAARATGELDLALDQARALVDLQPNLARSYRILASVQIARGDSAAAETTIRRIATLDPKAKPLAKLKAKLERSRSRQARRAVARKRGVP